MAYLKGRAPRLRSRFGRSWKLQRCIGNEKRPSMKVSVAIGGSLNRISHHALSFFAKPPAGGPTERHRPPW
jgi:hypothetical protein